LLTSKKSSKVLANLPLEASEKLFVFLHVSMFSRECSEDDVIFYREVEKFARCRRAI